MIQKHNKFKKCFIFIGFFFPSYFWTFQIVGLLWEFFEIFLDRNESETIKYLDGCLSKKPKHIGEQSIYNFKVYKNVDKYLNPVDRFFNIKNSKIHFWQKKKVQLIIILKRPYICQYCSK